ncbi:MAG: hypothetical protein ABW156_07530 [Jiangellaceae bacterium]
MKALGEFVRWQDIYSRLRSIDYRGTSYPLLPTWGQTAKWIDVCVDERWRRVEYIGRSASQASFSAAGTTGSVAPSDFTVAPAGYYSDSSVAPEAAQRAELSARFQISGHEIRSSKVTSIRGPYLTFAVLYYPAAARWVDEFGETETTLHFKDPRVSIPGMMTTPYNRAVAVSHRWLYDDTPDRRGVQFQELIDWSEKVGVTDNQAFMIDFCSLPQRPRTDGEEEIFRTSFAACQKMFGECCMALSTGSSDYELRAWCMLECMVAAKANAMINVADTSDSVQRAHRQAQDYVETFRWKYRDMQRHRLNAKSFVKDQQAVIAYAAHQNVTEEIKERFAQEFQVTYPDDRHLIMAVLDEEFFAWKTRDSTES